MLYIKPTKSPNCSLASTMDQTQKSDQSPCGTQGVRHQLARTTSSPMGGVGCSFGIEDVAVVFNTRWDFDPWPRGSRIQGTAV